MTPSVDSFGEPSGLSSEQAALVQDHLQNVLSSAAFAGSKRAQEFLKLTMERVLSGRADSLKERVIGAEMFGRPIDYDTANDAVVRVKATEVRRRLAQYYQGLTEEPPVRIELPVGSYAPKFLFGAEPGARSSATTLTDDVTSSVATGNDETASEAPTRDRRSKLGLQNAVLVAVGLLALATIVYFASRWVNSAHEQPIRSIAILPLANLSGDPNQEYFADGMTEELIAEMSRIPALRVISRTSIMTYKGTHKQLPEIARELQVDGILEGSVGREGNRVRVVAQLIDARQDKHIWAHSYDQDMTSVLQMQSDIAQAISDEVQIKLTPQQQAQFNRNKRNDPVAVELYLKGMERMNTGNPTAAIDFFREAIDKDPNWAQAHASLASAYGWMGEAGWMSYTEAFSQQKEEARKAIALDDTRPEPHLELGIAAMNQGWDWATQKQEFQRALEISPNAPAVHWAWAN